MTERTGEKRQHRLLVVEDEPSIRMRLEATLSLTGYGVRSTDTGVAALTEAARLRPADPA
ncbi:response regulator [Streptomyces sp. NPDC058848]|uniref:response regulator n=1 Tax=unclassified Streptomyces TaxID=2593676 RepID=UPI0036770EF4